MMTRSIRIGDTHIFADAKGKELVRIKILRRNGSGSKQRLGFWIDPSIEFAIVPARPKDSPSPEPEPRNPLLPEGYRPPSPSLLDRASTAPRPGPPLRRRAAQASPTE